MERGGFFDDRLSFVSTGVCGRDRGTYVEENGPLSRSIEG